MKKISGLLLVGLITLFLSLGYSAYFYWQGRDIVEEVERVEFELSSYRQEDLKQKNSEMLASISAKRSLKVFEEDLIKWSAVFKEIVRTLPKSRSDVLVDITSYSGGRDSAINMNVKTKPGSRTPYLDVATLIEGFDSSESFVNVFVPSISAGVDSTGQEVLSFSISTQYVDTER